MRADYIGSMASRIHSLLCLLLVLPSFAIAVPDGLAQPLGAIRFTIDALPQKDIWAGMTLSDAKVGYSHTTLAAKADGRYEITTESILLLQMLGSANRVEFRTRDTVRADLTLERFDAEFLLGGNRLKIDGRADADHLKFTVDNAGNKVTRDLQYSGPLYPAAAVGFHALVSGFAPGRASRFTVFNPQSMQIGAVEQRVKAYDPAGRFNGQAYEIATRMEGQDSTLWLDRDGRFLLEVAMNGMLAATPATEQEAKAHLLAARLNTREVIVGISLVKADQAIQFPGRVDHMQIELKGIGLPLPSGPGQRCTSRHELWDCELESGLRARFEGNVADYLGASLTVPAQDARIRRLALEITAASKSEEEKLWAILRWLDAHIRKESVDGFSALDVLSSRRGECQGHSYLYAALARASGIPTRVANGLVYSAAHEGFLYHTWAESVLGGEWRAVDPTFGQPVADATHIKIVEGEDYGDLAPLTDLIGKVGVRIQSYEYGRP